MKHKIYNIVILGTLLLASCTDLGVNEDTGSMPDSDEFNAEAVFSLRAGQSPDNVVTMTFTHGEGQQTRDIYLQATRPAESSMTVTLASVGEEFVDEYSEATGIDYQLLPTAFWRFSGGDRLDIAAGSEESQMNTLTIFAVNTLGILTDMNFTQETICSLYST